MDLLSVTGTPGRAGAKRRQSAHVVPIGGEDSHTVSVCAPMPIFNALIEKKKMIGLGLARSLR
ncbi:MAG: hypothetical protein KDH16_14895 [Rhodocyclaceae bacterium]|nr:hypothetical protein [Rhodocyclaceae bacterium]